MCEKISRCDWCGDNDLMKIYHDTEFGVPTLDDFKQFEHLMPECLQCGLNWKYVLNRRNIFRNCFDDFDFNKIVNYNEIDISRILNTPNMLKSPRKIAAIINNAKKFLEIRQEFGTFSNFIWDFVDNVPITYKSHSNGNLPAENYLSKLIAKNLKSRGFKYVGSVTVYSHFQGVGIINDHFKNCFHYKGLVRGTVLL